jgi:hypothetical protein
MATALKPGGDFAAASIARRDIAAASANRSSRW